MSFTSLKFWLENSSASEITALSDNWEDDCDDESDEQKEGKTKERLDDCVEFFAVNFITEETTTETSSAILPLGKYELSSVHLEILAPPPKV